MIDNFHNEYSFLSNFHPVKIAYEGTIYPSVEHAYQAAKTLDPEARAWIASLKTPAEAKAAGKQVKMRPHWDLMRIPVMHVLLSIKFRPNSALANKLINTMDEELVEGNTWGDTFWGVSKGEGKNVLGKLLMGLRDQLLFGQGGGDA